MAVTSARVTYDSIVKQTFWNLFNLLNDRSNVPDPNDSSGKRKFVYRRMPNLGRGHSIFPFIVVSRTRPRKLKHMVGLGRKMHSFDFSLMVYTRDSESDGEGNPHGADMNDIITNNIIKTLDDPTNKRTLLGYQMSNLVYDIETDEDKYEGRSVFVTEFDVRFENNLIATT